MKYIFWGYGWGRKWEEERYTHLFPWCCPVDASKSDLHDGRQRHQWCLVVNGLLEEPQQPFAGVAR